jgi:hypothetical protein
MTQTTRGRAWWAALLSGLVLLCGAMAVSAQSIDTLVSWIDGPDRQGITPVYWLGTDGELHHIQDPATAARCFGPDWISKIRWCGNRNRSLRGGACLRDFARLRGRPIRTGSTCPQTSLVGGGACTLTGSWRNRATVTTTWTFTPQGAGRYAARERGGCNATGTATLTGRTVRLTWSCPAGYAGLYQWELNAECTRGTGSVTHTGRRKKGTVHSTITRQ